MAKKKPRRNGDDETQAEESGDETQAKDGDEKPVCGLVMPISEIDGCPEHHWAEVRKILSDAAEDAGFKPNLVSIADNVGVIHKRIVQNLYGNPIVVVDVSGKNPNVMFELGMRLTFDKPTVIVKDDETDYSFDTSPRAKQDQPTQRRTFGLRGAVGMVCVHVGQPECAQTFPSHLWLERISTT